jgi:Uri superfamily endonuclease
LAVLRKIREKYMEAHPGTYALILSSEQDRPVMIGKKGEMILYPGYYVYIGSAFGPGGIKARVGHHLRKSDRPHWHLDYLRNETDPVEVWYSLDDEPLECKWADLIKKMSSGMVPLPGFGASDCECDSHLFYFPTKPTFNQFCRNLKDDLGSHAPLVCEHFP